MARRGTLKAPMCEPLFFLREVVHQLLRRITLHAVASYMDNGKTFSLSRLQIPHLFYLHPCQFKIGHPAQRGNKSGLQSLFLRKPNGGPAIQDAVTVIMHFQRFSLFNNAGDIGFQDTAHHQQTARCECSHISCHIRQ